MKIYASKRAMLVSSVARRNDSFGADTEGFALSSQRKLSVLLVVGIIILSAKDCDMKPVGPGGAFAYICPNGTVTEGTAKVKNTEKCSACNEGFELSANACVASSGTIAYVCPNGIIAAGIAEAAETEKCNACAEGFELNSANECVVETFAYICTNGTAVAGTTGTENTEKCSACDTGFGLNAANECVDNVPPAVVTLTATLPTPSVGTVQLDWAEPADTDFSHLLISWTPNTPDAPIQVNKGTTTTVIPASGLTSGTEYTFTAKSVDTTGNESAPSTGATATPVSCPTVLFATTGGTTYPPQENVTNGTGHVATPYLIPLVDGVDPACPIVIEFDYLSVPPTVIERYFRIDNMPTGATYTSSTLAWTFNRDTDSGASWQYKLSSDGLISAFADIDISLASIKKDTAPDMGVSTVDADFVSTNARTLGFYLFYPSLTDSLTLTLTP